MRIFILISLLIFCTLKAQDLECKMDSKLDFLTKVSTDSKAEKEALNLVIESIKNAKAEFKADKFDKFKNLDSIINLAKSSNIARIYIYQIHGLDYTNLCKECTDLVHGDLAFILEANKGVEKDSMQKLIDLESHALKGEKALCDGLKSKDSNLFIESYAHFALSGLNNRAINVLLYAAKQGDTQSLEFLKFLLDYGIYIGKNPLASSMIANAQSALNMPNVKKSFSDITEFDAASDILENMLYTRLVVSGEIMPRQNSRYPSLDDGSKKQIQTSIDSMLNNIAHKRSLILKNAEKKDMQTYEKIIEFKGKLKNKG